MHPDPHVIYLPPPLEEDFQRLFLELYTALRGAFPHPFDWMGVLERPRWWQFRARAAHIKVAMIFAEHGLLLTDQLAWKFMLTAPQRPSEDAGGAIIRRLRQVFQWQTGVPFQDPLCIEGGRGNGW